MNQIHLELCSSAEWADTVRRFLIPWSLEGIELGDHLLELGPGPGRTTEVLLETAARITALDLDEELIVALAHRLARPGFEAVHGDATRLPFADGTFSAVVSCTRSPGKWPVKARRTRGDVRRRIAIPFRNQPSSGGSVVVVVVVAGGSVVVVVVVVFSFGSVVVVVVSWGGSVVEVFSDGTVAAGGVGPNFGTWLDPAGAFADGGGGVNPCTTAVQSLNQVRFPCTPDRCISWLRASPLATRDIATV